MALSNKPAMKQPKVWLLAASARWLASSLSTGPSAVRPSDLVACDLFGDWDLTTSIPHQPCRHWVDDLPRQPWQADDEIIFGGGLENHWELLAHLSARCRVLGFAPHQTYRAKTPEIWSPILRSCGFSVPDWITVVGDEPQLNLDLSRDRIAWLDAAPPTELCPKTEEPAAEGELSATRITPIAAQQPSVPCERLSQLTQGQYWLLKPRRGAGGHQIRWWPSQRWPSPRTETGSTISLAPSYFLQRYIPGPTWSASFLATAERCWLIGACNQLIGHCESLLGPPFQYQGAWGPLPLPTATVERLQHLGETIARHFSAVGLFGVDLIGDPAGDWSVVEINPRPTSSMEILEDHGTLEASAVESSQQAGIGNAQTQSLIQLHRQACLGLALPKLNRSATSSKLRMKRLLYHRGTQPLTITPALFAQLVDWQQHRFAADIPHQGSAIPPGQPICTLFAEAKSPLEARRTLNRLLCTWQQLERRQAGGSNALSPSP